MKINKIHLLNICFSICISSATFAQEKQDLTQYVDPMIGTAKMGHTYPGATVPFGSIQLSPDTDTIPYGVDGHYNPDVYKYCGGYQYDDPTIVGFSHTHFSGTGHSDLGDLLMMPTVGELQLNPGTEANPESGYRSRFSHDEETAEAGYYQVKLQDYNIEAELTASTRVGMHQYTFPKSDAAHVILDLKAGIYNYDGKNVWTFVRVENDTLITGYRQTSGWARTRKVYFALSFSKPFKSYGQAKQPTQVYRGFWGRFDQEHNFPEMAGRDVVLHFDFDTEAEEKIQVKMAISPVSTEGALNNMQSEIPGWDFDKVREQARQTWNKELQKVTVQTLKESDKTNFYTAMYHAFMGPTEYIDVDGNYMGLDRNVHQADGFVNYTSFSLWDTYRALHPLFNILQPDRNTDMIQSMLVHHDQSVHHMLPIWSHYANENWCMIGYHSASVIADAIVKDNVDFDANKALDAMVETAKVRYFDGIGDYIDDGYVPEDKSGASVSKTLEYAYDDWCIAQFAKALGKKEDYKYFSKRAENWKKLHDKKTNFFRPKTEENKFVEPFIAKEYTRFYSESNAWQYYWFVPQDIQGLIKKTGGSTAFKQKLDSMFSLYPKPTDKLPIFSTGMIGQYNHGNEPSHHVAYLYNYVDKPSKAQERIREILKTQYKNEPNGHCGNEDCGQMSSWYVFSALGFYPVNPAQGAYILGIPLFEKAEIKLPGNKKFIISTQNFSDENTYVKRIFLNGELLKRGFITHSEITNGGQLLFEMTADATDQRLEMPKPDQVYK